ncbi:MAG: hypothetical protein RMJ87_11830 [Cytophagales bacterium]|nr:hypothetical protein [Bernardetiaceae bacterium]MDW8205710.1 hypothetical protein [Cytophagales bacterium]
MWLCYTLTAYSQVSSHCYVVENFQSVCTQTTPNRKFTISFTIKVQLSFLASINAQSLAAVTIASMSGGSISVSQVALQNNQANVSFTYDEATVSPMLILRLGFTNGQNEVCRAASNFNLSSCVPAANCNQTLAFNPVMASVLTNALASYQGETASFMAGLQTGPGNDKVKAITYETTNVKRIIKSPGQPDKIIDWGLIPLVAEHFQKTPSDYKWISMSSAQLIFPGGRDFSANAKGDKLWGAMFYMPPAIAGCKEEFTFNLKAIVEFENGCIKEQVFANQKITR